LIESFHQIEKGNEMREMILEMVDEMLDSEGDVKIGNLTFSSSQIVKECDPIAYSIMVNDIVYSQIEDLKYDLERSVDEDEIIAIIEKIAELEDFSY
jgi:hypothetical protein